jgi:hypothetical protein
MANWRKRIDVDSILTSEEAEDTTRAGVAKTLERLAVIIESEPCFSEVAADMRDTAERMRDGGEGDVADADYLIATMYDIADAERVWMGA